LRHIMVPLGPPVILDKGASEEQRLVEKIRGREKILNHVKYEKLLWREGTSLILNRLGILNSFTPDAGPSSSTAVKTPPEDVMEIDELDYKPKEDPTTTPTTKAFFDPKKSMKANQEYLTTIVSQKYSFGQPPNLNEPPQLGPKKFGDYEEPMPASQAAGYSTPVKATQALRMIETLASKNDAKYQSALEQKKIPITLAQIRRMEAIDSGMLSNGKCKILFLRDFMLNISVDNVGPAHTVTKAVSTPTEPVPAEFNAYDASRDPRRGRET
jgi:hypothetical protein